MKSWLIIVGILIGVLGLTGCASTQGGKLSRIDELDQRLSVLDQRVQALEYRPSTVSQAALGKTSSTGNYRSSFDADDSELSIRSGAQRSISHKDVQLALKNAGFYDGPIDGKIGPMTQKAIRTFQSGHSLKADGIVGAQTRTALATYLTD